MILAGGRRFTLEAAARKDREHSVLRVLLQRGPLLDCGRILAKQVGGEFGVPEVLHLVVLLIKVAVE